MDTKNSMKPLANNAPLPPESHVCGLIANIFRENIVESLTTVVGLLGGRTSWLQGLPMVVEI